MSKRKKIVLRYQHLFLFVSDHYKDVNDCPKLSAFDFATNQGEEEIMTPWTSFCLCGRKKRRTSGHGNLKSVKEQEVVPS